MNMVETVSIIGVLLFSVIVHECAHGLTALWCGDPTAKEAGRLTLNPLKHIDPFGTVILPGLLILMRHLGAPVFPVGYAKAVPVNFSRLRHPKRDMLWVELSGPAVNIVLAISAALVRGSWTGAPPGARRFLALAAAVNLFLAVFNLTPIPPLDGSRVVFSLLPDRIAYQYAKLERFGIIIVLVLLNFGLFDLFTILVGKCLVLLGIRSFV